MNENLKNAINKMGMSSCPTGFEMSIDLLLEVSPKSLDKITDSFGLTNEEIKAFEDYVETRRNS